MKIAVWHNLPSGGGKRALFEHVSGLVSHGHYVEIWAPPTMDRDYLPLSTLAPEHIVPLDHPWSPYWRERWQLSLFMKRSIKAMDAHCARCAKEIDDGGFDVLFANSCQFYRTTSIGRFSKTPSAIYLGEPYRWLYEAMPNNRWAALEKPENLSLRAAKNAFVDLRETRNGRLQVREEIKNAKAFERILCNSYFSRESILRAYGIDAEVCYLGIDTDHFTFSGFPRANHVVGLGAFTREKNLELCIRAIGEMDGPRPTLIWIGNVADIDYLNGVRELAERLGVGFEPRIRVEEGELLEILGTACAMLYAPRLEPFGLAPLEAGACGTPVIAVAEGGVRETVVNEHNGLLVDASPGQVAAALTRLRDDPALAARLGLAGRRQVMDFWSKDAATDRLIDALQRCMAVKPAPA